MGNYFIKSIYIQDVDVDVSLCIVDMDEGQIGHVRPHLKGSGDFTIDVRWAYIRRVFFNFVS
jgi:hypothetical protein